jgi:fatty-acyl-CoA synthase
MRVRLHNERMKIERIAPSPSSGASAAWLRALAMTATIAKEPARTLPAAIQEIAVARGDAPALVADGECLTYRMLAERARRYGRWALRQGVGKGDVVCLMLPNSPDYMAIWLGITGVGGIVALINTNLTGRSLAHCIDIVKPKHIIVAEELREAFESAGSHLKTTAQVWPHGELFAALDVNEDEEPRSLPVTIDDCALYIYTSGTTGLPKAAKVSHRRLMTWSAWFAGMIGTRADDRMYNCLPMYHSVGGVVATGAVLLNGGSVALAQKFSASRFWDDVARFDCTLFQYIGELCRYLVQAPPHPSETTHRLRLAIGNGLRPDVWEAFRDRFKIPQILEFYASTEGNVTMFNAEGKPGAIGRTPAFLAHRSGVALVKFDVETGEPMRDAQGFCLRCADDQVGEALGLMAGSGGRFEGYTSADESEKKIQRDVFKPGDAWFRTGDLMRKDAAGFYYFVDRVGDTFRWHGENVSTAEVAEAISSFPGVIEATVYGVAVPGRDGRAGMAAIAGTPDLAGLWAHLAARLPDYARPVFLRLTGALAVTATFKHRKNNLAREGFAATADPVFVADRERKTYVPLDKVLLARVKAGTLRL